MKRIAVFGFLFVVITLFLLSCQKELSQESNLNNATFSLHDDSSKACFPIEVSGNYYNGVPAAGDLNFITVIVNVQKTGNYNIASSSPNGFSFADSGFFSKTGLDTLVLKARGTPILIQTNDFVLNADSLGTCGFSIEVQDSTGTGLGGGATDTTGTGGETDTTTNFGYGATYTDPIPATLGTWKFTDSTNSQSFSGTVFYAQADDLSGEEEMRLTGDIDNGHQFYLQIATSKIAFTVGSYRFHDDESNQVTYLSTEGTADGYSGLGDNTDKESVDPSYINVTSYDTTTGEMKGSFRCWATKSNDDGSVKTLVLLKGSFDCIVN